MLETPEERTAREAADAQETSLVLADLADVLETPAGYRVILRMIRALGGGNGMLRDQSDMILHNVAIQYLQEIQRAHPAALIAMCGDLWGVPHP